MEQKKALLTSLLLFIASLIFSQNIDVKSFKVLPNDQTARVHHPVIDQNAEKCALIKVVTSQKGFVWEGGTLGITKVEKKTGEYWVYIPRGSKKITIKHDKLGVLREFHYPEAIKKATVYEMLLTTGKVKTIVEGPEIPTVQVMINSIPEKADVYIDENYIGQTPLKRKIRIGKHNYRISKDLFEPRAGVINLNEGQGKKQLNITLNPNYGNLVIHSRPEKGAQVFIDGKNINKKTPCTINKLASGSHILTLRKKFYEPISKRITVKSGKKTKKQITMKASYGEISIETNPAAQIYQDEEKIEFGDVHKRLMPGVYTFKAEKAKHHSDEKTVEIQKGDTRKITLNLQPKYGTLEINTDPEEANIQLNGKNYGKTPKNIDLLLTGEYNVILEKEGYKTISKIIEIKENESVNLNEELISGKDILIRSNPSEGTVKIDGKGYGRTPVETRISFGTHEIEIEKGSKVTKKEFKVEESDENNIYHFHLKLKNHLYLGYSGSVFPNNTEYIAPYGLRVGMLGEIGWYLSGQFNQAYFESYAYEFDGENVLDYTKNQYYRFNGKINYPLFSLTGGCSFYLGGTFHVYVGGGYGSKKVYRQMDEFTYSSDQKVKECFVVDKNFTTKGIELEGGLILHTRPIVFNVGISNFKINYTAIELGMGINF